ncbi:transcriptional regulator [Halorhodospira halophila]|nr:transcriptional regulator [Halorhodospira halophila]MBK5943740.1 transcriptional regulator [Halorhodospira halophila]
MGMAHSEPDAETLAFIAAQFRALGEPLRLQLLHALRDGEKSVGELVALTGSSQPNISRHLAVLRQHGLVRRRSCGTLAYFAIAAPHVFDLCDAVCGVDGRMRSATPQGPSGAT